MYRILSGKRFYQSRLPELEAPLPFQLPDALDTLLLISYFLVYQFMNQRDQERMS